MTKYAKNLTLLLAAIIFTASTVFAGDLKTKSPCCDKHKAKIENCKKHDKCNHSDKKCKEEHKCKDKKECKSSKECKAKNEKCCKDKKTSGNCEKAK